MANTRDVLGEQETLDALVARTLTSFEEDGIGELRTSALFCFEALESAVFPNLKIVGIDALRGCLYLTDFNAPLLEQVRRSGLNNVNSLNEVDFAKLKNAGQYAFEESGMGEVVLQVFSSASNYIFHSSRLSVLDVSKDAISSNVFRYAYFLSHLIIRTESVPALPSSAFNDTPLGTGIGWIYVPSDLVDSFKSATNWSNYAEQIVAISEYPKKLQNETISDTWAEIFEHETIGDYATRYSVGDIKYVNIGGTNYPMQIVAFNSDNLANENGKAKITWLGLGLLNKFRMNKSGVSGGWGSCELRSWLRNIIYPQIESGVKTNIKPVTKTYYKTNPTETLSITDTIWIPSTRELFGEGSSREASGYDYTAFFTDNASRIKKLGLSSGGYSYWNRSVSTSNFRQTTSGGVSSASSSPYVATGVVIGFCT